MGRPFFPLFFKDRAKLNYLSMEQRGELLTALFAYAEDGEIPDMDGLTGFAFEVFREGIDTSLKKYEEVCDKRREAGKKGGRPSKNQMVSDEKQKNQMVFPENQTKAKKSKKTEIEAEAEGRSRKQKKEVEDEAEAEAEATPALPAAIKKYFYKLFGRQPSAEFLQSAAETGLPMSVIKNALQECKDKRATSPEGYATTILRRWAADGIPSKYQQQAQPNDSPPDAPLPQWEQDWLEEYLATNEAADDEIDFNEQAEERNNKNEAKLQKEQCGTPTARAGDQN